MRTPYYHPISEVFCRRRSLGKAQDIISVFRMYFSFYLMNNDRSFVYRLSSSCSYADKTCVALTMVSIFISHQYSIMVDDQLRLSLQDLVFLCIRDMGLLGGRVERYQQCARFMFTEGLCLCLCHLQ